MPEARFELAQVAPTVFETAASAVPPLGPYVYYKEYGGKNIDYLVICKNLFFLFKSFTTSTFLNEYLCAIDNALSKLSS